MLGLRGVRLGLVIPGLFALQVRAIAEAAARGEGRPARTLEPEIMVPLVGAVQELEIGARGGRGGSSPRSPARVGVEVDTLIGTMIEVPRAALTAGQIAEAAEFFSFGTNDLTQMTWGFSRDGRRGLVLLPLLDLGIFGVSPFETLDREGVGALVEMASRRAGRPAPTCTSGCAASTGETRTRCTSSTRSAWTTCRARRSASRRPARGRPRRAVDDGQRQPLSSSSCCGRQSAGGSSPTEATASDAVTVANASKQQANAAIRRWVERGDARRRAAWRRSRPPASVGTVYEPGDLERPGARRAQAQRPYALPAGPRPRPALRRACGGSRARRRSSSPARTISPVRGSPTAWSAHRSAGRWRRSSARTPTSSTPPASRTTSATRRSDTTVRSPSTGSPLPQAVSRATRSRSGC